MAGGLAGTDQTVVAMIRLAASESATEQVRVAAEKIVRALPGKDYRAESLAVQNWVRNHIRYTRDGLRVETLKTPTRMLSEIARTGRTCADCDDASILIASLLLSIGHAPAFEVVGRGDVPHHVMVFDKTTDMTLDATMGEVIPGEKFSYRKVYDVVPVGMGIAGLGQLTASGTSPFEKYLPLILIGKWIFKKLWRK